MEKITLKEFKKLHDEMDVIGYAYDSRNQTWRDAVGISFRANQAEINLTSDAVCLKNDRNYMEFRNIKYVVKEESFEIGEIFSFVCENPSKSELLSYTIIVISE